MCQGPGLQEDPDPGWQEACAVTTRGQAKKVEQHTPLRVPSSSESAIIDKENLIQMQHEDEGLQKYWNRGDTKLKGQAKVAFEVKSGVLYRAYKHPRVDGGKPVKQVMVPTPLEKANYGRGPRIHNGRSHGH